ncbi:MAG: PKD domain-containing protein [Candidatus Hydrogenedentes bacterium]|nr:PKD domain-containing protein [Candidatus Hydrogenedentota bacterium]
MRNLHRLTSIVLLLVLALPAAAQRNQTGFGASTRDVVDAPPTPEPESTPETKPDTDESPVDDPGKLVQSLNLRQRVSQLMLVTLTGTPRPDASDQELLAKYSPGGVILPPVSRPTTAASYVAAIRQMPMEMATGIPLFIGTNLYELPRRGNAQLDDSFIALPSLLAIAAANDADVTKRLAGLTADHLTLMGFNFHLGPSLSLAPTLPDATGSIECLGSDPAFVGDTAAAIVSAMTEHKVIAVPMGFPGGGANRAPRMPAILLTPSATVAEIDLLPFKKAIEAGVEVIHVGNTLVPTLDPANEPASLSSVVMRDILRQQLGFQGVIIAGPMDTNDIAVKHDPTKAAIMALQAGADMIYWNEAGRRVMKTVDDVVTAIGNGEMSQDAVDTSLARIIALKEKYELRKRELPTTKDAAALAKKKAYPDESYEIERRSITLVQNRGNVLPLNKAESVPVGVTGVAGVETLADALEEYIKPVSRQRIGSAKYGGEIYDFEIARLTSHIRGIKTVVVIVTPDIRMSTQLELISALRSKGVRVVVVLVGYPSTLPDLVDAEAIVLSYSSPDAIDQSMRAVADVLVGQGPLGLLPVVRDIHAKVGEPVSFSVLDILRSPSGMLPVTIEAPFVAGLSVPYDPTFSLRKVEWDFGDGKQSKEFFVERAYTEPGRYPITLTVTDKLKQTTSRTLYAVVE